MLEYLATDKSWLGIATLSGVLSLFYVSGQALAWLWGRRSIVTNGIRAYRLKRLATRLEDLEAAIREKEEGYSDFAIAAGRIDPLIRAITSLGIDFLFLMLIATSASMLGERGILVGALVAMLGNVMADLVKFGHRAERLAELVRNVHRPEAAVSELGQRIAALTV